MALSYCGGCGPTLLQAAEKERKEQGKKKKMAALLPVGFASGFLPAFEVGRCAELLLGLSAVLLFRAWCWIAGCIV